MHFLFPATLHYTCLLHHLNLIQNGTVEPAHSVNNVINSSKEIVCCDTCKHWYHKTCSRVGKQFDTLTKSKKNWQCSSCLSNIFPFHGLDNNKILKIFAPTKTNLKNITTKDKHNSHLPFSILLNDDLKSLSFNSNNKPFSENINLIKNVGKLTLDVNTDKYDFFFTDIDENTTLDTDFKYYDITDLNKLTQPISESIGFSILHSNIQSLNCNGEKSECLLNSINNN